VVVAGASQTVIDVTDDTFGSAVLEESMHRPVVVDFWAGWCQPCKTIGPVLERLASEKQGAFLLAKLDVDANQRTAQTFGIMSIPAVKAFRGARLVEEFVGAIPESAIRQFIDAVVPSEADMVSAEGEVAEVEGRIDEADRAFRAALELDPKNVRASLGLARLAAARGDFAGARALLTPLRPEPEAERVLAALDVSEWASGAGVADDPALAGPMRAAAEGRFAQALEAFIRLVIDGGEQREPAREAMLKLFAVLGDQDPLTQEYRRKLATALF
jgi:putative thioredoxin